MSVIVEDDQGKLFVYTKGAESEMASLLVQGKVNETYQHIDDYARHGLRTLVIAMKEISKEDLQQIEKVLLDAANSLENRKERVMSSYSRVEKKLKLLGATAVEDKLQDQVPETIADLKRAGIKVWVLTGDKLETAISVAYSCNLLDSSMTQMILARQADSEACGSCVDRYYSVLTGSTSSTRTKYALIVDGRSLHMAMKFHLEKFSEMCQHCAVVLCCRMSPIQKGNVVSMVKSLKSRPVTAAIGDGANDVSMIQEAHVGFGLMGKEGRQAVNSCDFAFAKFKYVKRVLLVHGNLFYYRVAMLIHYFFYKNVIFVVPQFLFSFYNAFSSQTLYHGVLLMLYNMIYTASPILIYGIVERPISLETLMDNPSLYKKISKNRLMRPVEFLKRFLNGFFHGLVLYVTYRYLWVDTTINQNGKVLGLFAFGTSIYHGVVCVANFKLAIETRYWTVYSGASLFLSILALPAFCSLFSSFRWGILDDNMYGVYNALVLSWSFWLVTLIVIFLSLLPDFLITIVENTMNSIHIQTYFDKRIVSSDRN
ncbi:Phospholipid-transporting ATPase IF [Halotydeus destructor]|nr:Phospholipid-transporting ATPase IF [Halotydeus destructor]